MASMGPRLISRGDSAALALAAEWRRLQWGHG